MHTFTQMTSKSDDMMQISLLKWLQSEQIPLRIGFIWKSIKDSIKERAFFWMIQFPCLREKPHCSPTWLWMTNPICTPPCAFNTQHSSKLKIWLSSPVLLHLNLVFCFVMTPCDDCLHAQSSRSVLHILSFSCLLFRSVVILIFFFFFFLPVTAAGVLDCTGWTEWFCWLEDLERLIVVFQIFLKTGQNRWIPLSRIISLITMIN